MNRIDSPLQAKAKRRQSDAKWRASVATCYDTLKYVVPNVKNMAKRKISKALILQESEKHIKELESAVTQLLEVEGKKREKTVLWEEESHWTHCTLGKLRQDFSEKQQRVFQMAAHGRRCYNLLQDIKEEVFAMEADPSRLAIMEETFQATSSLPSKICTLNAPNIAREGADTGQGVPPIHKINLVLSGPSTANQQQSLAPRFNRRDSNLETTTSQVVPKLLTHASSGPDLPSTLIPMSRKNQTSHIESKPITLMANFSTLPNCTSENVSSVDKRICALSNNSCTSNGNINVLAGTNKSFSTLRLSNNQEGPAASHGYSQGFFKDNSDFSDSKSHVTSAGAASVENSQRLKIHIERVNGDFYIISDSRNSMIHLIKATPSTGVVTSSEVQLQKTSLLAENDQDQEVPSMKLPVKLPTNTEQEENENYSCRQQFSSAGFRELLRDNSCIKQDIQASLSVCSASDGSSEEAFETVQENIGNFYTVDISSEISERSTPCHRETTLPQALDIKEENVDTYTTRNNRDPLLSSLATPKPDDSTPLFMRTDNDLIIKRPPKMGTARKKLNFGQSPDKHNSWNTVKAHRQAGGFTPVKLPNEFGMVPDEDGNSIGSLISPWKIVDSPSYACGVSTQNCLASATMLDLDDSLICLETMDTMDLEDHCDSNNMFAAPGTEEDKIERTVKRKVKIVILYWICNIDFDTISSPLEVFDHYFSPSLYELLADKPTFMLGKAKPVQAALTRSGNSALHRIS
ncbi:hypothetical protein RRG08_008154 [Elysia crispata]|uniref:BHLH domain-containing protein n=1 Tax=Elysia crispata TaxID=231223 RepID=A0AAE0Z4U8_9GAST|nr:hypothetical protein RRG08_008154 [Elysia crispata]